MKNLKRHELVKGPIMVLENEVIPWSKLRTVVTNSDGVPEAKCPIVTF